MKTKNPNRIKHSSFSEFILNDDKIVMKLLLTIAKWIGPVLFTWLAIIMLSADIIPLAIIFGIFAGAGWYQLSKFYRIGGSKNLEGMTAAQTVWNKDKIIVGKQNNEVKKNGRKRTDGKEKER